MKKKSGSNKRNPNNNFDALLKEFEVKVPRSLQEHTIKNFILYTIYFFNIQKTEATSEKLNLILAAIEKAFKLKFRNRCESLLSINTTTNSRDSQNKRVHHLIDLPLQTGVNGQNSYGFVTLRCSDQACEILGLLVTIKPGGSVDKMYASPAVSSQKFNLFLLACSLNSTALIDDLVLHGAHDFKSQEHGKNPLQLSVLRNHVETTRHLFEKGYVCVKSEALIKSIYLDALGNLNTSTLEVLITYKFHLSSELESTQEERSQNPLFMLDVVKKICRMGETQHLLRGLELLLKQGYRVDGVDDCGQTVLSYALDYQCFSVVLHLLNFAHKKSLEGIINYILPMGCTVLAKACANNRVDIVQGLLERGADPNIPTDKVHLLPLFIAQMNKNEALVNLLKQYKAKEIQINEGALFPPAEYGEIVVQRTLIFGICSRNSELTQRILASGDSPDLLGTDIKSPIFYAITCIIDADSVEQKSKSLEIFHILLSFHVNVNLSVFHEICLPPLCYCMMHDVSELIPSLLALHKKSPGLLTDPSELMQMMCAENSLESFRIYQSAGFKLFDDLEQIVDIFSLLSLHTYYTFAKELISCVGGFECSDMFRGTVFGAFSTRFVRLSESEQIVFKGRLIEVLSYLSWFIGLPVQNYQFKTEWNQERLNHVNSVFNLNLITFEDGNLLDSQEAGFTKKMLLEMREVQKLQVSIKNFMLDKIQLYCNHHDIKITFRFRQNVLVFEGDNLPVELLEHLLALGVKKDETSLFFPYPTKIFLDRFCLLFTSAKYLQIESTAQVKTVFQFYQKETVVDKVQDLVPENLSNRCWGGLIDEHHADVLKIKYCEDYLVLLPTILEPQGCTPRLLNRLKRVNNLGAQAPDLIARLRGAPLFLTVDLGEGETQHIRLTHRLTKRIGHNETCSVVLGTVSSEDRKHIYYVGLLFTQNSMSEPAHLAEIAQRCKQPLTIRLACKQLAGGVD